MVIQIKELPHATALWLTMEEEESNGKLMECIGRCSAAGGGLPEGISHILFIAIFFFLPCQTIERLQSTRQCMMLLQFNLVAMRKERLHHGILTLTMAGFSKCLLKLVTSSPA
jgi:hypothetical protein